MLVVTTERSITNSRRGPHIRHSLYRLAVPRMAPAGLDRARPQRSHAIQIAAPTSSRRACGLRARKSEIHHISQSKAQHRKSHLHADFGRQHVAIIQHRSMGPLLNNAPANQQHSYCQFRGSTTSCQPGQRQQSTRIILARLPCCYTWRHNRSAHPAQLGYTSTPPSCFNFGSASSASVLTDTGAAPTTIRGTAAISAICIGNIAGNTIIS